MSSSLTVHTLHTYVSRELTKAGGSRVRNGTSRELARPHSGTCCAPSPDDAAADFIMKRDDVPLPLPLGEKGHIPPVIATDSDGNPIE